MSRFDGHIRDLGEIQPQAISSLTGKLSESGHLWESDATKFSTDLPAAQHIVFKFPDNYPDSHSPASYRAVWIEWEHLLAPIIATVVENLRLGALETSKIMFTRLNPGGTVPTHVDLNPSSAVPHKIHVPLMTHPKVIFRIEGSPYHLPVGRAYELNNLLPHSVENASDVARVHFIFDCFPVNGSTANG